MDAIEPAFTVVSKPAGYISPAVGAKMTSTPQASHKARSLSSVRG